MLHFPALKLSNGFTLDKGIFNINIVQQLHEKLKENFVSTINMSQIACAPIGFEKQKVKPSLTLFSKKLTYSLRHEFKNNKTIQQ